MTPRDVVDRLARDAAHLVMVAAPGDWPGGFHVVVEHMRGALLGMSVGDGAALARTYRRREGFAVLVDVPACVWHMDAPSDLAVAALEALVIHEAGHALVGQPATVEATDAALDNATATVLGYTCNRVAELHQPTWAAATWLLCERAARYRRRTAAAMLSAVARDVARYGYTAGDLESVTRGIGPEVSLRELLAPGGAGAALVDARLPGTTERAATVAASGIGRVATGVVA